MRPLYCVLVRMHPSSFRSEFGDQMISIFDEITAMCRGGAALCLDAAISLVRQWLFRTGLLWKALVSIAVAGFIFALPLRLPRGRPWVAAQEPVSQFPLEDLIKITLVAFGFISIILVATVSWSHALHRRRASAQRHVRCARWK